MNTLEKLIEGRRRIVEVGWTQGANARDMLGGAITYGRSYDAACFCAQGAVDDDSKALKALKAQLPEGYSYVREWNDDNRRTREEVIALFDKAIEAEPAVLKLAGVEG